MKIIYTLTEWQQIRQQLTPNIRIGLVPTMGCLHLGHQTLLERSVQENDISILTIFVNPTQFNDKNDLTNYPQTFEQDIKLAEQIGIDFVLIPDSKEIYADNYHFNIHCSHPWAEMMEGTYRPNHFNGMLTVVLKLLLLIRPYKAYFGEKDYQQYQLVNEMAKSFFLNTIIVPCGTVREPSKLPYSSRNKHLTRSDRKLADQCAAILHQQPTKTIDNLITEIEKMGIDIEYIKAYNKRLFAALRIGNTRIIDNFKIEEELC